MFRYFVFKLYDLLNKKSITNHYKEIQYVIEHPNNKDVQQIKADNLQYLLNHAVETTPFYSNLKDKDFSQFPIIDKQLILEGKEKFMSNKFERKELVKHTTSGSTGIPFISLKDKNKIFRNYADTIYFSELAEYNLGEPLVYVRLWVKKFMKSKLSFYLQNIIPHNILENSKGEIEAFLNKLKSIRVNKTILVYPSYLEEMCRHLDENNEKSDFNIKSIITSSEKLNDYEREKAKDYFNCEVYERYSNMENGILAQTSKNLNTNYVINDASYVVEFLNVATNEPVSTGEVGKIVVTDLFNYAMPFVRYDTGDLGIYEIDEKGNKVLNKIYGRKMDAVYNTSGKIISPHIFYKISHFAKIKQYQFIQLETKKYQFKLNGKPEDADEDAIKNHFLDFLGNDAELSFEYVDDIIVLKSGKRKKVVNQMLVQQ